MTQKSPGKVLYLPETGVLLFATDLHGNWKDYQRLRDIYAVEEEAGNDPFLLFCGDLIHGPSPDLNEPGQWPYHLGTPYRDESSRLIFDFQKIIRHSRTMSLLGNHEHAHIGGPTLAKFYEHEAAVLEGELESKAEAIHGLFRSFPLLAVSKCGAVFTHAAPSATAVNLKAFEGLSYRGFEHISTQAMTREGTVGALLWSRQATAVQARALLRATSSDGRNNTFVAYGHDVVKEGYEVVGDEQICLSTSYSLEDRNKVYLRLDLSESYESARALRRGHEIRQLWD